MPETGGLTSEPIVAEVSVVGFGKGRESVIKLQEANVVKSKKCAMSLKRRLWSCPGSIVSIFKRMGVK